MTTNNNIELIPLSTPKHESEEGMNSITSKKRNNKKGLKLIVISFGLLLLFTVFYLRSPIGPVEDTSVPTTHQGDKPSSSVNAADKTTIRFHQNSFGGIKNVAHFTGARALVEDDEEEDYIIPVSNVERAIPSLHKENIRNLWGHYVHDEHQSPYASFLYDRPKAELVKEQNDYIAKMNKVREEWGAWTFHDTKDDRPVADLSSIPYKDFFYKDVPEGIWQNDKQYVTNFINEADKYIDRIKEGIYAEYGYPTKDNGKVLSEEEIKARNELFQVNIADVTTKREKMGLKGASWMTQDAHDGFVRKLLHAMITNDEFYVVLGGHSAAAGHGNNFFQDYMIQFHYLMEPVFNRLGMRLISRDLAMGGLGTLHFSFGQRELYGEKDFLIWDSGMTERSNGDKDLFNKQAILNGERVPIIFTAQTINLKEETGGDLWAGDLLFDFDLVKETEDIVQVKSLPFATQYLKCAPQSQGLCKDSNNKYHNSCWEPRTDLTPSKKQVVNMPGQASWHPGDRDHQFRSRKIALTVLHSLQAALEVWKTAIDNNEFPLKEDYWHVGETYQKIQSTLETNLNGNPIPENECEKRFVDYPRICRTGMSGMGEFTPRATDENSSIHNFIIPGPTGYVPDNKLPSFYSGISLLPYVWKIPDDEVDVHAIAIATSYKAAALNEKWENNEGSNKEGDSRRSLRYRVEEKLGNIQKRIPFQSQSNGAVSNANESENDRVLDEDEVVTSDGWFYHDPSAGFCDGSSMTTCNRFENDNCIMRDHNDHRASLSGDALSGWVVIKIPKLKKGLILARMEWWHGGHVQKDGGRKVMESMDSNADKMSEIYNLTADVQRRTGGHVDPLSDDFKLDIAIDGKIYRTMEYEEFMKYTKEIAYNEAFFPFLDDKDFVRESGVELGLRARSEKKDGRTDFSISHIYYA